MALGVRRTSVVPRHSNALSGSSRNGGKCSARDAVTSIASPGKPASYSTFMRFHLVTGTPRSVQGTLTVARRPTFVNEADGVRVALRSQCAGQTQPSPRRSSLSAARPSTSSHHRRHTDRASAAAPDRGGARAGVVGDRAGCSTGIENYQLNHHANKAVYSQSLAYGFKYRANGSTPSPS
jgi:hypothetical protein